MTFHHLCTLLHTITSSLPSLSHQPCNTNSVPYHYYYNVAAPPPPPPPMYRFTDTHNTYTPTPIHCNKRKQHLIIAFNKDAIQHTNTSTQTNKKPPPPPPPQQQQQQQQSHQTVINTSQHPRRCAGCTTLQRSTSITLVSHSAAPTLDYHNAVFF